MVPSVQSAARPQHVRVFLSQRSPPQSLSDVQVCGPEPTAVTMIVSASQVSGGMALSNACTLMVMLRLVIDAKSAANFTLKVKRNVDCASIACGKSCGP